MSEFEIRLTERSDYRATEELTREAFWNLYVPGCDEHFLLHTMRGHKDYLKDLDFVVTVAGKVVGNIVYTTSSVLSSEGDKIDAVSFGPIAVHPAYQKQGVGGLLVQTTKRIVSQLGIPAIIILGLARNYVKHGFVSGHRYNIGVDFHRYHAALLVHAIDETVFHGKTWKYLESDVYDVNEEGFDIYDQSFPRKEKGWSPSQEEYWISSHSYIDPEYEGDA